jgi:hypothetical protein
VSWSGICIRCVTTPPTRQSGCLG